MREERSIYQVEESRIHGPKLADLQRARDAGNVTTEEIEHGDRSELVKKMPWWREQVNIVMSLAQAEQDGNRAVDFLLEARGVITQRYQHRRVWEIAASVTKDPNDTREPAEIRSEYVMLAAMYRDMAKYLMQAAAITGNTEFLVQASRNFEEAMWASDAYTSENAVATMEHASLRRRLGVPLDHEEFADAYQRVLTYGGQNNDRVAAMSRLYMYESARSGKFGEAVNGFRRMKSALQADNRSVITYVAKDLIGRPLMNRKQRNSARISAIHDLKI